jgi:FdhE protein
VSELFLQIAGGVDERCPDSLPDSALIRDLCGTGKLDFGEIIEAAAESDPVALEDMAADADVNADSFLIVVRESLRPFVFCAALERVKTDWHESEAGLGEPECPTCGSEPSMAEEVREPRLSRLLVCSFCGTMWPTQRPLCLFCDNQDPGRFTSMESGSAIGARADVCDSCKMYVKVLPRTRSDKGNPISLYIDSLLTEHLDLMLDEEGYEGTGKDIFSIF